MGTDRRGWNGWLRALGLADWKAPDEGGRQFQYVIPVGDDRELTSYMPGIKGSTGHVTAATAAVLTAYDLQAGPAGARVILTFNSPSPVQVRPFPTALALGAAASIPINWHETPTRVGSSTLQRGTLAVLPSTNATALTTGFMVGPFPEFWVPPNAHLQIWSTVVNVAITLGLWITEHASAAGGELR